MALDGTYAGLQASFIAWVKRSDLPADDLCALAETRIARDLRLRSQLIQVTLSTTIGSNVIVLPTDMLELENVSLPDPNGNLTYVTVEYLNEKFQQGYVARPGYYSVEGPNLLLAPTPDAVYTVNLAYYQRFPALAVAGTNALLTTHPDVYLWAMLAEASPFMVEDSRTVLWEQKYKKAIDDAQAQDETAAHSGSVLRVKAV